MKTLLALLLAAGAFVHAAENTLTTTSEAPAPATPPKWSFGYSYSHYAMEGTTTANTNIYKFGKASVGLELYTLTWTPNPAWTVIVAAPYIRNEVETIYEPVNGGLSLALTDRTEGLGDVRLMAMRPVRATAKAITLVDFGGTVPTGKTDSTFTSAPFQGASYNMQLGSGTPDLILGVNQLFISSSRWTQHLRLQYTERLGRNRHGWALGDEWQASAASKYQVSKWFSGGLQANYKNRAPVQGRDSRYELMNNYRSNVAQGDGHQYYHDNQINYDLTAMLKAEHQFRWLKAGLELGAPVWQDARNADDIRLDTRYYVSGSASAAF